MDIIRTPPYEEMQRIYNQYFSLGHFNADINTKFALIALVCHLVERLKEKKPDVTHYQVIRKLAGDIPEDYIKGLAVICSDFAYGCKQFPTFGIEDKKIPAKIKEILSCWLPF